VPANGRRGRPQGKCHREQTAHPAGDRGWWARVKRCGKSAPRPWQQGWQGKPHREQDRIGVAGGADSSAWRQGRFRSATRVGRARRAARRVPEEWLPRSRDGRTEPGLQAAWQIPPQSFPQEQNGNTVPFETCSEVAFHFTYKFLILFTESARYLAQKLTFPLTPMFAHDIPRYPKGGVSRRNGRDTAG
jgi:hypothetical protein